MNEVYPVGIYSEKEFTTTPVRVGLYRSDYCLYFDNIFYKYLQNVYASTEYKINPKKKIELPVGVFKVWGVPPAHIELFKRYFDLYLDYQKKHNEEMALHVYRNCPVNLRICLNRYCAVFSLSSIPPYSGSFDFHP